MSDEKPARDPILEDARINALEARLKAAREREDERNRRRVQGVDANYRSGNRALASLLGGIIGGLVIGFAIDAAGRYRALGSAGRSVPRDGIGLQKHHPSGEYAFRRRGPGAG